MSYRYGGGGDRDRDRDREYRRSDREREYSSSSSSRRDSPPRHRSRRSPSRSPGPSRSPRPRDDRALPESFGRVQEAATDDDLGVLQRMRSSYNGSPLQVLYQYLEKKEKVKIWTRNYKEVRGVMTGYIIAFDKHWNIILSDVDEVFLKYKKTKTPFLRDLAPNESLPDFPQKAPKKKSNKTETETIKPEPKKEGGTEKKKKRGKKPKATSEKRQVKMLFVRGDNIVIISPAVNEEDEDEEEEEEEGASG